MLRHLFLTFLLVTFVVPAASAHEQSAVTGGKRVQPTKNSVEQRVKEHEARQKPNSSIVGAKPKRSVVPK
jgi:hypothetical protein